MRTVSDEVREEAMTEAEARLELAQALAHIDGALRLDGVDPAGRLRDVFDLDSIDFTALVEILYVRTGVNIPEHAYALVETLGGMLDYLVAHAPPRS